MENYELGEMNNDLFLKINVGTVGTACSVVFYYQDGMSKPKIAESDLHSGNIGEVNFGKVNDNKNKMLHFRTDVDLSNINPKNWQLAAQNLVIKIEIKGGINGAKVFNLNPDDLDKSNNGQTLLFNKLITLS